MKLDKIVKYAILIIAIFTPVSFLRAIPARADITTNLEAHWELNEASWNGTPGEVLDSSGNTYNGVREGNATTTASGKFGRAGTFDGNGDSINFGNILNPNNTSWTYSLWLKTTQTDRFDFNKRAGNFTEDNYGIIIVFNHTILGGKDVHSFRVGNEEINYSYDLNDGQWHNIVMVRDASQSKLFVYVDGGLVKSQSVTIGDVQNTADFKFINWSDPLDALNGQLDDVRVYSRALSQADAIELYSVDRPDACDSNTGAWYKSTWSYRKCFSSDSLKVSGSSDLTNIPLFLDLSTLGTDFFSNVNINGSDIVITSDDGTTKLSRELVDIDIGNETGELWFKAPLLDFDDDTVFYIYYGNPLASESNSTDVWDSNYISVKHIDEDPSTSSLMDSTSNSLHATAQNAESGDLVPGVIGNAIIFDGVNEYIDLTPNASAYEGLNTGTVSFWLNTSSSVFFAFTLSDKDNATNLVVFAIGNQTSGLSTEAVVRLLRRDNTNPINLYENSETTKYTDGNWHYITYTGGNGSNGFTIDGVSINPTFQLGNSSTAEFTNISNVDSVRIGSYAYNSNQIFYAGTIDEFRVSNIARSADWSTTEYRNQLPNGQFFFVSGQENGDTQVYTNIKCPSSVQPKFQIGSLGYKSSGTFASNILNDVEAEKPFLWSITMNNNEKKIFGGTVILDAPGTANDVTLSSANSVAINTTDTGTYTITAKATNGETCATSTITVDSPPANGLIRTSGGITVTNVSNGTDVTEGSGTPDIDTEEVYIRDSTGDIVASVLVDKSAGRDWRQLTVTKEDAPAQTGLKGQVVVHFPGGASAIPGNVNYYYTLYIPVSDGYDFIRVCPGASDVGDVTRTCVGGASLTSGSTYNGAAVSSTTLESRDLLAVRVTGTGGISVDTAGGVDVTLTPNEMTEIASQEVCLSYIPYNGEFFSTETIELSFTPTLAGAPTSTDTDADNDTTADGSFTNLTTTGATYTFTGSTTQATTSGIDLCLTFPSGLAQASYSIIVSDSGGMFGGALLYVGDSNGVLVTVEINPTLSFNIRNLSDTSDINTCDLGQIDTTTTPNTDTTYDGNGECGYGLAIGTNATSGVTVQILADAALNNASNSITSAGEDDPIVAGTEAYGLVNITAATSGRNAGTGEYDQSLNLLSNFTDSADFTPVPTISTNFLSYSSGIQYLSGVDATDITKVMHGMTAGAGTPAGQYDQLVTYTITANF